MAKYTSEFPNTEDPLNESGEWSANTNLILTSMRSAAGKCIANAIGVGSFDDSAALLVDAIGDDFEITSKVFFDGSLDRDATHECELLLRASQTAAVSTQYEALFSFGGGIQFVRWFNNGGTQDFAFISATFGDESLGTDFQTGDFIRARAAGTAFVLSVIRAGVEDVLGVYINNVIATGGQPGIGGFTRQSDGGDASKFCFQSVQISDEFILSELAADTFNRANENPLSGGSTWSSCSGVNQLRLVSNAVQTITADSDSIMRYTGTLPSVSHYSTITIGTVGSSDCGPAICIQSNGDCILVTSFDASNIYIYTRIGGSFNELNHVVGAFSIGSVVTLRRNGSKITLTHNSVDVLTVTEETLFGGTYGIFMYDGTSTIDAWAGGNVIADYLPLAGGGGGTVYTSTATDTVTIVDVMLQSLIRGRNSAESTIIADASINNAVRGRDGQEVLTSIDQTSQTMLRNLIASDLISTFDEVLMFFIRQRVSEDSTVIVDELVAAAGRIVSSILSSNFNFADAVFLDLQRGVIAEELINLVDSVVSQFNFYRDAASDLGTSDETFNFRLLTARLQSALLDSDSLNALFISGTQGEFDGSKTLVGYQRKPIAIGGQQIIKIGAFKVGG